jgi:penicillin-binding protein 1A
MTQGRRKAGGCLKTFLIFFAALILIIAGLVIVFSIIYINSLPTLEELTPSPIAQTSKVYDIDGNLITEFHAEENREIVSFSMMSDEIKNAIVAVEDKRFYDHQGVDYIRIIGAAIADIRAGELAQGGSTITQQLIKNIYFSPEKSWRRKINEALIAIQLERHYTKDKILEMYLNTVLFGSGTYGIEKASQLYLGKNASDLNIPEAALLAGLVQSPEVYSPFNSIENAKQRRDLVLKLMYEQGYINSGEYIESLAEPIIINSEGPGSSKALLGSRHAPYFIDFVKQQLYEQKFSDYDVFKGGLRIYTTLDMEIQKKAEKAVKTVFPDEIKPSYSLICSDPNNGYIYALIGGKDYSESKFNIATQGKRQPGSVFKTAVLMESTRQGFSAKNEFNPNGPITIDMPEGPDWIVDNYGGQKFDDDISVADATIHSVNVVYAQLIMKIGAENVESLCKQMEINDTGSNPAIALGGLDIGVTPLDISKIFSTLASGGVYHRPVTILKITDPEGNILYQYNNSEEDLSDRILEEPEASYITRILKKVIEYGTGSGADIGRPAAGKTGTTTDNKDAWFAGYTPELVTVVWMGNPASSDPMEPINGRTIVGGTYPADIWREFMLLALEDKKITDFKSPEDELIDIKICSESGLLPVFWCPEEKLVWNIFVKGSEPVETCDVHNRIEVPDVRGISIEEAKKILDELFIEITEVNEFNDTYNRGIIFDQSPEAGSFLESLTGERLSVILYISKGEKTFKMPDLTGSDIEHARDILKSFDMEISEVIYQFNDDYPVDIIFKQDPPVGTQVTSSSEVQLIISKGENPEGEIPDAAGLTEEEALELLFSNGFENVKVNYEESEKDIGKVFSQIPEEGTIYNKDSEIIIMISSGILVPDVTGMQIEDALTILEDMGFTVLLIPEDLMEGEVKSQEPSAGQYINFGSEITLELKIPEEPPEEEKNGSESD